MPVGTSKGVVVPVQILRALNWQRGDLLVISPLTADSIMVRRVTDKEVRELKQNKAQIEY